MTKTFALVGHPVSHSLSPQIHAAAYADLALPYEYLVVDCPNEQAAAAQVQRLRDGEIAGLNFTVPWKRFALTQADAIDESALATGAANVLCYVGGQVVAHNTDAPALGSLLKQGRANRDSETAVVLGSGGAALAAVVACRRAGARRVYVTARKWQAEVPIAAWANVHEFVALGAIPCAWGTAGNPSAEPLSRALTDAQIIVQSTSAGMLGVGQGEVVRDLIPWGELDREVFLYDVVYNPARTPFLNAAAEEGLNAEGGLSMLVLQAALGFELWLGIAAPLGPMKRAAEQALYGALIAEAAP